MSKTGLETASFNIRLASWIEDNKALRLLREAVFIKEQSVPVELEWDGEDGAALHLLATDDNDHPLGTARMLADGHIGRVAVLREWRNRGVGQALMLRMLQEAQARAYPEVFLDAQIDALGFYQRLGFQAEGEVFMDAGIPHRHMRLSLTT
jgi:predicted GNAT family N-acyltransferase